jgi:hypothetical protein
MITCTAKAVSRFVASVAAATAVALTANWLQSRIKEAWSPDPSQEQTIVVLLPEDTEDR